MATTLEEMSRSHFAHANLLMVDDPLRAPIVEGAMGRELMDRYLEREARARNYAQRF